MEKALKYKRNIFRITDFAKNYLNTVSIVIVASLSYGIGLLANKNEFNNGMFYNFICSSTLSEEKDHFVTFYFINFIII